MAGKLRMEAMKGLLLRLDGVNRSLDSMVMSLEQSSEHVKKSLQSQTYLNQIVDPRLILEQMRFNFTDWLSTNVPNLPNLG